MVRGHVPFFKLEGIHPKGGRGKILSNESNLIIAGRKGGGKASNTEALPSVGGPHVVIPNDDLRAETGRRNIGIEKRDVKSGRCAGSRFGVEGQGVFLIGFEMK